MSSTGGRDRSLIVGTASVLVAAFCFGTLGPVTRAVYAFGLTSLTFAWWRAAFGGLALFTLIAVRSRSGGSPIVPRGVTRREVGILIGATGFALMVAVGLFGAYARMSVAVALITFYTYPVMVAVVGFVLLGEPIDRSRLASLALALIGMALVVGLGTGSGEDLHVDPAGLAFAICAGIGQAGFALLTRRGFQSVPSEHATGFVLAGHTIALFVLVAAAGETAQVVLPLTGIDLFVLAAYSGIVTSALATTFFVKGIRTIGPLRAGIVSLFEPVVGVALAALFLGERLGPLQLFGGMLVLAAAALIQRSPSATAGTELVGAPVAPVD